MAVMKDKSGNNLFIDCMCGCNEGIRVRFEKDDYDTYAIFCFTNGNFYAEQNETVWRILCKKLKKIWAIIRNNDFYYADVRMTKDEFDEFKEYISLIK